MAFPKLNFKSSGSPSSSPSRPLVISNFLFRSLQFVFALAVIGLYAKDLAAAHHEHKYTDSKWAYAVAVGTLAAVTSLVFSFPKSFYAFGWDIIIL